MAKSQKKGLQFILFLALAAGILFLVFGEENNANYISYIEFNEAVQNEEIESVTIETDRVEFQKYNDEELYYTDNPEYEGFKEKLLLAGVQVTNNQTAEDPLMYVLDILFYVIFLVAVWIGSKKLIEATRNNFKVIRHTGTRFSDIAGMDQLKHEMTYAVDILKNPGKYKQMGIRPTKGIILEGPPGN